MKSIVIYYFSGTGNTEIIADMIREEFRNCGCVVTMLRIEDILKRKLEVEVKEYDLIGIGCPVIGYGVPNIVSKFVRCLPREKGKNTFVFRTAGGVAPINYNASKTLIRQLGRKGYEVFHERVFSIGSNWVVRFEDGVMRRLFEASRRKVAIMCGELLRGEERILETGIWLRMVMRLVTVVTPSFFRLVGKDLVVSEACSKCGLCIRNCPSGNIYEKNDRIHFRLSCNSCLRCVYSCPKAAIGFRFLKFFPVPGGYDIEAILKQPWDAGEITNEAAPPFFNSYINEDSL